MILLRQRAFGEVKRINKAKKREWLIKDSKGASKDWLTEKRVRHAADVGRYVKPEDTMVKLSRNKIRHNNYVSEVENPINRRKEYESYWKKDLHSRNSFDRKYAKVHEKDIIDRAISENKEALDMYKEHKKAANKVTKKPKGLKESVASVKPKKSILRSKTIAEKIRSKTKSPTWAEVVRKALR